MKFWKGIAHDAWAETVSFLHLNSRSGFVGWLVGTLAVLGGLIIWGSADAAGDEFLTRLLITIATFGLIPFVFAWKFVGEPPRAYDRLCEWSKELEAAILESQDTDKTLYGIAERYNDGLRLFKRGEDMKAWESEFDLYIKRNFDAGLFLQLCGPQPPERGYTTIQRGDEPVQRIDHPPPSERDRLADKLHRISGMMPYADTHYRGRTINSLSWKADLIRRYGHPEHREPEGKRA